jgi:hypothetical protein
MPRRIKLAVLAISCLVAVSFASAALAERDTSPALENPDNGGGYIRGAFSIGVASGVTAAPTLFGVALAGGYRFSSLLATEVELSWVAGTGRFSAFGAVWNGRVYPLSPFDQAGDFPILPYALIGVGGGDMHNGPGSPHAGSFIVNLGIGADWMLTDRFGLYSEVAHRFYTAGTPFNGVTAFNFGSLFRF